MVWSQGCGNHTTQAPNAAPSACGCESQECPCKCHNVPAYVNIHAPATVCCEERAQDVAAVAMISPGTDALLLFVVVPCVLLVLHVIGSRFEADQVQVFTDSRGRLPPLNRALFLALVSPLKDLPLPLLGTRKPTPVMSSAAGTTTSPSDRDTALPPLSVTVRGMKTDPQALVQLLQVVDIDDVRARSTRETSADTESDGAGASSGIKALSAARSAASRSSSNRGGVPTDLPLLYFDAITFRLVILLAAHGKFPWSILGSVKMGCTIRQVRPASVEDTFDVRVCLGHRHGHRRGTQVEFITRVYARGDNNTPVCGGELVWESVNTLLFFHRVPSSLKQQLPTPPGNNSSDASECAASHDVHLHAALGRQYAAVCRCVHVLACSYPLDLYHTDIPLVLATRDFNPIHMSSMSAKLFGFKRTLVHGMCLADVCLARMLAVARHLQVPPT